MGLATGMSGMPGGCSRLPLLWEIPDLGSFENWDVEKQEESKAIIRPRHPFRKDLGETLCDPATPQCHHPKAGTQQFPPLEPHSSQHSPQHISPQHVARRWHKATRVCQVPKKPAGLQHNRCADESQVQKAIIFHQQKCIFLSQITPISSSKENNPRSEGGRRFFGTHNAKIFCRIRRFKRTNVKDYFAIIQAIFSPHCSRTIRVFKCEQKDLFITIIIKRNIKSMNLFACSIKLALLLSSVASCHINHTQFVYLSTISLFYFSLP